MSLVGCHLLHSRCLRSLNLDTGQISVFLDKGKENRDLTSKGAPDRLFSGFGIFLEYLVVIQGGKEADDVVQSHVYSLEPLAAKVKVISPLAARLNFAVDKMKLRMETHLVVVTVVDGFRELHILEKTGSHFSLVEERKIEGGNIGAAVQQVLSTRPSAKVLCILCSREDLPVELASNVVVCRVENWDSMLLEGGLVRAQGVSYVDVFVPQLIQNDNKKINLFKKFEKNKQFRLLEELTPPYLDVIEKAQLRFNSEGVFERKERLMSRHGIHQKNLHFITFHTDEVTVTNLKITRDNDVLKQQMETAAAPEASKTLNVTAVYKPVQQKMLYVAETGQHFHCAAPADATTSKKTVRVRANLELLLAQIPPNMKVICLILIVDGANKEHVEPVSEICGLKSINVVVMSEVAACLMCASSQISADALREGETCFFIFLNGNAGQLFYLRRENDRLTVVRDVKGTKSDLKKDGYSQVRDIVAAGIRTEAVVFVGRQSEIAPVKAMMKPLENAKFVIVSSSGKAAASGGVAKAKILMDLNPGFLDVAEFCGPIYSQLSAEKAVFSGYQLVRAAVEIEVDCEPKKETVLFQKYSILSDQKYVIFKEKLPLNWKKVLYLLDVNPNGKITFTVKKIDLIPFCGIPLNVPSSDIRNVTASGPGKRMDSTSQKPLIVASSSKQNDKVKIVISNATGAQNTSNKTRPLMGLQQTGNAKNTRAPALAQVAPKSKLASEGRLQKNKKVNVMAVYAPPHHKVGYANEAGEITASRIQLGKVEKGGTEEKERIIQHCEELAKNLPERSQLVGVILVTDDHYPPNLVNETVSFFKQMGVEVTLISEIRAYLLLAASHIGTESLKEGDTAYVILLDGDWVHFYYLRREIDSLVQLNNIKYSMTDLLKSNYHMIADVVATGDSTKTTFISGNKLETSKIKEATKGLKNVLIMNRGKAHRPRYLGGLVQAKFLMKVGQNVLDVTEEKASVEIFRQWTKPQTAENTSAIADPLPINPNRPKSDIPVKDDRFANAARILFLLNYGSTSSKSTVGVAADKPIPSSGSTKDLIQIKSTRNSSLSSTMSDLSQQKNSSVAREAYKLPVHPFISKDCMRALSLPNSCCIRLILERNEVSVEVLKQSKCTYVRSPMRTNTVSACISFAGEKPCVGQTALQDKADHPEYVVSDILSILKTNKLSPDRDTKVHFKGNTCFIRCMTSFGERLIPRHVIFAVMLTALIRMAEKELKQIFNQVYFMMPSSFMKAEADAIRKGCECARLVCMRCEQYSKSYLSPS